jgi:hypothetical protein
LQDALKNPRAAIREVEAVVEEMHAEKDPLAVLIFVSRRNYRNVHDTKSGKRHLLSARLSWQQACDLGFRGNLEEWERLLGADPTSLNAEAMRVWTSSDNAGNQQTRYAFHTLIMTNSQIPSRTRGERAACH